MKLKKICFTLFFGVDKLCVLFKFYLAEESDNEEDEEKINTIPEGIFDFWCL